VLGVNEGKKRGVPLFLLFIFFLLFLLLLLSSFFFLLPFLFLFIFYFYRRLHVACILVRNEKKYPSSLSEYKSEVSFKDLTNTWALYCHLYFLLLGYNFQTLQAHGIMIKKIHGFILPHLPIV
jgi:hypothetical protein